MTTLWARPRPRVVLACAWIAAAACMAAVVWRAANPATVLAAGEPGAELRARALSDSADQHMLAGRFHLAIALLDRFERSVPRTTADFEGAYGTALGNTAVEARVVRGLPIPVTRSAIERVAMLRASLGRVTAGERKADQPRQVRDLRVVRAGQLAFWGFVREGYYEYWNAHDAQPLDPRDAGQAAWLEARFLAPVSDTVVRPLGDRPGAR